MTNLSNSLRNDGYEVSIISFDWRTLSRNYLSPKEKIYRLKRGGSNFSFYFNFAFKLTRELFKCSADVYFAEDIYTLPFVTLVAKLKKAKIIYNSRELYAFIGGLTHKPLLQKIIKLIESLLIKRVDLILTTGEMDSAFINNFYKVKNTLVIRNLPLYQKSFEKINLRQMYNIPNDKVILLYQGVLIGGRGIKLIMSIIKEVPEAVLILFGDGEEKVNFKNLAFNLGIDDRVIFGGTIPQKQLINYTSGGDIGIALIENISISYYHALPNKLFEYIMAGLPVLSSNLPQMKNIVENYKVGKAVNIDSKGEIIIALKEMIQNKELLSVYKANCEKASLELNWQKEFDKVKPILYKFF
ncbi:glycosyltransferase [Melioribacteraceae bacterium 4301-Me]|uniref:glycosyltransferase n=1 Tax=Pyranulibacter aquaticus TaxID=3163344 RepID=UPI00359AB866